MKLTGFAVLSLLAALAALLFAALTTNFHIQSQDCLCTTGWP